MMRTIFEVCILQASNFRRSAVLFRDGAIYFTRRR